MRELACPFCGAAARGFCANCGARVEATAEGGARIVPAAIEPGELLRAWDLRREPLPGHASREDAITPRDRPTADGVMTYPEGGACTILVADMALRDQCVALEATTTHPKTVLGVAARLRALDGGWRGYFLWCDLGESYVRFVRMFFTPEHHVVTPHPRKTLPDGATVVGRRVRVELRVRGPTLAAYVDDRLVHTEHDPHFGFGVPGLQIVQNDGAEDRAVHLHRFEVRAVRS